MAVTQAEIARAVGVSQTIVSDVLQGRVRGRVRPETRERILETANRLGYRPNALAQALRARQSHQIAYLTTMPETQEFAALRDSDLSGVARTLRTQGYRLLIEIASTRAQETAALAEMIRSGVCDGGVVRAYRGNEELWSALKAIPAPVVVIGQCPDPELTSVAHDVFAIMDSAVHRLVERGHRHIGMLVDSAHDLYRQMLIDFWKTLAGGLDLDPMRWFAESDSRSRGYAIVADWLTAAEHPTAVISLDMGSALGASAALRERGGRLGAGLDLIAIGDISAAWLYDPGTMLYGTDLEAIGVRAAEEILAMLGGAPGSGPVRLIPQMLQL